MRISKGNVGIGIADPKAKLDVSGEVKVASSGIACSTTNEGSIRYNSTDKKMEFCNGTAWTDMGGAASGTLAGQCLWASGNTAVWPALTCTPSSSCMLCGITYTVTCASGWAPNRVSPGLYGAGFGLPTAGVCFKQ